MREKPGATEDAAVAHRREAQGLDPVKKPFSQRKIIDVRRRGPAHSFMHVTRIVQFVAQARMRLQCRPIRQIDSVRRNIVNGGPSIVPEQRARRDLSRGVDNAAFWSRICEGGRGSLRPRRLQHAQERIEEGAIVGRSSWGNRPSVLLRRSGERRRRYDFASDPNSAGRGGGRGAVSLARGTAGVARTFSRSGIAAGVAGAVDSRFGSVGASNAIETGAERDLRSTSSAPVGFASIVSADAVADASATRGAAGGGCSIQAPANRLTARATTPAMA